MCGSPPYQPYRLPGYREQDREDQHPGEQDERLCLAIAEIGGAGDHGDADRDRYKQQSDQRPGCTPIMSAKVSQPSIASNPFPVSMMAQSA